MGFYFRVAPGIKVRATSRGLRTSIGPRGARLHVGAGGAGISTGAGPFTYYQPLHGSRSRGGTRRPSTGDTSRALTTATRSSTTASTSAAQAKAEAAAQISSAIQDILDLHRTDFPPATAPVAGPPPGVPSYEQVLARHLERATDDIGIFHLRERAAAKAKATAEAQAEFARIQADAEHRRADLQTQLDEWWASLQHNDAGAVLWSVRHAFEDNEAAAAPVGIEGSVLSLMVHVPTADAVPDRIPGATAAGNLSLRKATKSQRSDLYKLMVFGYVLVTVKEAFAVAPGITEISIVAVREGPIDAYGARSAEAIAALRFERQALVGIQWQTADAVRIVNDAAKERVLVQRGAAGDLAPLDLSEYPELRPAIEVFELGE